MFQAYSTYALGATVTLFAVLHNDLFAGARNRTSDITFPSLCYKSVFPANTLFEKADDGSLENTNTEKMTIEDCFSPHLAKSTVTNPAPCLSTLAAKDLTGCYNEDGVNLPLLPFLLGTDPSSPRGSAVRELSCEINGFMPITPEGAVIISMYPASCKRAQGMAGWALALVVAGWVLAAIGMYHFVYQASFALFTCAALALLISFDAVATMTSWGFDLGPNYGYAVTIESNVVLPGILIPVLAIAMLAQAYGFYKNKEGYVKILAKY